MKEKQKAKCFYNYKYYCDRCGQEISFKDNTMKQVYIQYSSSKRKKLCDLCEKCYEALARGVKRGKEQKE